LGDEIFIGGDDKIPPTWKVSPNAGTLFIPYSCDNPATVHYPLTYPVLMPYVGLVHHSTP